MEAMQKFWTPVYGAPAIAASLCLAAKRFQSSYRLDAIKGDPPVETPDRLTPSGPVHLMPNDTERWFRVHRETGVSVSTHEALNISRYLGVSVGEYLLLGVFLGMAQWRALVLNPLIREEDLLHDQYDDCLYSPRSELQEYALLVEDAQLCPGCREFYCCLGAETELLVTLRLAKAFSRRHLLDTSP